MRKILSTNLANRKGLSPKEISGNQNLSQFIGTKIKKNPKQHHPGKQGHDKTNRGCYWSRKELLEGTKHIIDKYDEIIGGN